MHTVGNPSDKSRQSGGSWSWAVTTGQRKKPQTRQRPLRAHLSFPVPAWTAQDALGCQWLRIPMPTILSNGGCALTEVTPTSHENTMHFFFTFWQKSKNPEHCNRKELQHHLLENKRKNSYQLTSINT